MTDRNKPTSFVYDAFPGIFVDLPISPMHRRRNVAITSPLWYDTTIHRLFIILHLFQFLCAFNVLQTNPYCQRKYQTLTREQQFPMHGHFTTAPETFP
mmetsp:Transcript_30065/g.62437  ORF Transcript_30065/g.62437 Transcript_30065/m.62437 type:complete len:98 (-) Transcript_30065:118-411(-)